METNVVNRPHKWAKEIKAFVDGEQVEWKADDGHGWRVMCSPCSLKWFEESSVEFRIAPKKHKRWVCIYRDEKHPNLFTAGYLWTQNPTRNPEDRNCIACIEIEFEEGQGL